MTLVQSLLWPLSLIYGAVTRLRALAFRKGVLRPKRLAGTVISVGNLTVGGTGKTPMVLWLAKRLFAEGKTPAILFRGYRPLSQRHIAGGSPNEKQGWNDEAFLLRARLGEGVELGVGADRFAQGRALESRGIRWFLLDDGFQHLQLFRDVDIVLVDAADPFGGGHLLPAGRLREPVRALGRADIVLITRSVGAPALESRLRRYTAAPIFYAQTELKAIRNRGSIVAPAESASGEKKYFAFCGIGNPKAFFGDLRRWGLSVVGERSFRDHHRYTERDVARLEAVAGVARADALLCTEKDIHSLGEIPTHQLPVSYCQIRLRFSLNDEEGLWQAILSAAGRSKAKAGR